MSQDASVQVPPVPPGEPTVSRIKTYPQTKVAILSAKFLKTLLSSIVGIFVDFSEI